MQSDTGLTAAAPGRTAAGGGDTAPGGRLSLDIRRLPWTSALARDYAFDYPRLAEFYAGDPADPAAWREAIARAAGHARPRDAVVDLLQAQQRRRGAPVEAVAAAEALIDPGSVAIVTGQQAGLFGGPLFTLVKALTAIRLAERVAAEHHVPAVALFWVDAEDHDWDEVKDCHVLDRELAPHVVTAGTPPGAHGGAVARVVLDEQVSAALDELTTTLVDTEFTAALVAELRQVYGPGAGMADAFSRWLERVLGPRGLIVFDASDPAAKPLVAGVFAREVELAGRSARLAADAGDALAARGYHAQVIPQADSLAIFAIDDGREAIAVAGDEHVIGGRRESPGALADRVRRHPDAFSPNVLLRPIVQDTLFPTACYVAGPSELAYLGQLRRVYEAFGVPMPLVQPRASLTLLDANAARFLARHDIDFASLRAQDEAALNELLLAQMPPSVDASLQAALSAIEQRMDTLARELLRLDPTLEGAARSTQSRMQDDLKKLQAKIVQAAKRKDETLRRQFHHARLQAFPGGKPQERAIGFVFFLNRYGPGLVDRLYDLLTLETGTHTVVAI